MTTVDNAQRQGALRESLLARHPLVFFFIISYAGTWLVEMPYVLSEDGAGLLPFSNPLLATVLPVTSIFLGPFLGAFIMTGITEGRAGIRRFLRRFLLGRASVVPVRPHRHPRDLCAQRDRLTGGPGVV